MLKSQYIFWGDEHERIGQKTHNFEVPQMRAEYIGILRRPGDVQIGYGRGPMIRRPMPVIPVVPMGNADCGLSI